MRQFSVGFGGKIFTHYFNICFVIIHNGRNNNVDVYRFLVDKNVSCIRHMIRFISFIYNVNLVIYILTEALTYFHRLPPILINSHVPSSTFMHSRQLSCTLINSHVLSSTLMYSHQLSCTLINFHALSSTLLYSYQLSCTLINPHVTSSTLMYHPRRTQNVLYS